MKEKILTSNFSLQEQNERILKDIRKGEKFNFSFLNKNLVGIKENGISLLIESDEISQKLNPQIILSSYFLKKVFELALNGVHRNIKITINKDNLEIDDVLYNKKFNIDNMVFLSNKKEFFIDTKIFSIFKLNLKTLNNKSTVYIFDKYFLYENIRGETNFYYLKEI